MGAVALVAAAALALSACTATEPTLDPSPPETTPPVAVTIPSTPVGERVQWMIDLINQDADITVADLDGAFDSTFTDAVALPDVVELLNVQIRPAQPIVVTAYEGSESQAVAQVTGAVGDPFAIQMSLTAAGLIDGFVLAPAEVPDPAQSLDEVKERLDDLGFTVRYSVVRTSPDGASEVLLEEGATALAPMASMFKLYVLLAVHEQVSAGTITWDDVLTVSDENRSLPSGELQNEPNGTEVTVREAALKMISISDNTATDMLIERIGRDAVESAVLNSGHHDPTALTPFLMTREMFQLGFGTEYPVIERWAASSVAERRLMLESLTIDLPAIDLATVNPGAIWQQDLDWFASPADVAAVHEALAELDDPEVNAALTANPGIAIDPAAWPHVAFKGGSSMGVLTGSWRAVAVDGTTLTVVVMASGDDPAAVAHAQTEIFSLMTDVFTLTAVE